MHLASRRVSRIISTLSRLTGTVPVTEVCTSAGAELKCDHELSSVSYRSLVVDSYLQQQFELIITPLALLEIFSMKNCTRIARNKKRTHSAMLVHGPFEVPF